MSKLKVTKEYAKEFDKKCAESDSHGFLRFITHTEGLHDISILDTLADIGKTIRIEPYKERRVTYDESEFASLIKEFFKKYFPSKEKEVSQILDGTRAI